MYAPIVQEGDVMCVCVVVWVYVDENESSRVFVGVRE